jgi:hypothetical protein
MKNRIYNTGAIGSYAPISSMSQQISKSGIRNNMGIDEEENNNRKVNYTDLIRQYMSPGKQQYKAYFSASPNPVGISKAQVNKINMSHQAALAAEQEKYRLAQGEVGRLRPFEAQANDYMGRYNTSDKNLNNALQQQNFFKNQLKVVQDQLQSSGIQLGKYYNELQNYKKSGSQPQQDYSGYVSPYEHNQLKTKYQDLVDRMNNPNVKSTGQHLRGWK